MSFPGEPCWGTAPPVFTGPFHRPGCRLGRCLDLCGRPAKEMPWAASSFWVGRRRGARMWLGSGVLGLSRSPRRPSQQHPVLRGTPARDRRPATGTGAGVPRLQALLQVGVSGDRDRHRASRLRERWQLAPELGGHWGTQPRVRRQGSSPGPGVRLAEGPGRDRAASGGQGSGRASEPQSEVGLRSWVQGPMVGPSGSWWAWWVQREQPG